MTSLKGNLNSVDLANIFQMLSMNQREGTLYIFDGQGRTAIYFGPEGVSMLARGRSRQDSLGRILMRHDRITPEQLDEALGQQSEGSGRMLGQVLVEQGTITRQQVEEALRIQIEEEIYNLFICQDAQFEFVEGPPREEFSNAAGVKRITFNVNSLIMEAAQRIDEWEWIQKIVPTLDEIYRFTGENVPLDDPIFETVFAAKVLAAVDGWQSVKEIIQSSCVNQFEVCKVLALLIEPGALESLPVNDLREQAEKAVAAGDTQAAVKFLSRLVAVKGDTPGMHKQLAEVFEGERELEKAAFHYRVYAEIQADLGNVKPAFNVYRRISQLLPTDLAAADRMIEVFAINPSGLEEHALEVIATGKELAEIYVEMRRSSRAIQVLHRVVSLGSEDADLRGQLIEVYLASGMTGEAVSEYEALADTAIAMREFAEAEQTYRKILAIDRTRDDILAQLNQLISRRTERRRSARKGILMTLLVLAVIAAGWYGSQMYLEHAANLEREAAAADALLAGLRAEQEPLSAEIEESLAALAGSQTDEEQLLRVLDEQRAERHELLRRTNEAVQAFVSIVESHAGTEAAEFARGHADDLTARVKGLQEADAAAVRRLVAKAEELHIAGVAATQSGGGTRELLRQFQRALTLAKLSPEWLASENGTECQALARNYQQVLDDYEASAAAIQDLVQAGKPDAAFERAMRFLTSYPPPDLAGTLPVPVLIDSKPRGAKILLDGADTGLVTPTHIMISVRRETLLHLVGDGFDATELRIAAVLEADPKRLRSAIPRSHTVGLFKKVVFRTVPVSGRVDAAPAAAGNVLVVPTRGPQNPLVDLTSGEVRGSLPARTPTGIIATPAVHENVVALTAVDRLVTFYDVKSRRYLGQYEAPGELRANPLVANGRLILADRDGRLICVGIRSRTEVWRYPSSGTASMSSSFDAGPVLHGDEVYAAATNGTVHVVDLSSGKLRRRIEVRGGGRRAKLRGAVTISGDSLFAASADGRVFRIDRNSGKVIWVAPLRADPVSEPLIWADTVWVVDRGGSVVGLQVSDGATTVTHQLPGPVAVAPTLDGGTLFVGDSGGTLCALGLEADAVSVRWEYVVKDADGQPVSLSAPPAVIGSLILVAGDDRVLRALKR